MGLGARGVLPCCSVTTRYTSDSESRSCYVAQQKKYVYWQETKGDERKPGSVEKASWINRQNNCWVKPLTLALRRWEKLKCSTMPGFFGHLRCLGQPHRRSCSLTPESVAATCSMRERCAILQQRAWGAHGSHGPTFFNPSSQAINKHVIDPSSQNKLDAFWCQLYVRNKLFIFFPNIQGYLINFN